MYNGFLLSWDRGLWDRGQTPVPAGCRRCEHAVCQGDGLCDNLQDGKSVADIASACGWNNHRDGVQAFAQ